jgi:hypothetical protein
MIPSISFSARELKNFIFLIQSNLISLLKVKKVQRTLVWDNFLTRESQTLPNTLCGTSQAYRPVHYLIDSLWVKARY